VQRRSSIKSLISRDSWYFVQVTVLGYDANDKFAGLNFLLHSFLETTERMHAPNQLGTPVGERIAS